MTPVRKTLEKAEAEENDEESSEQRVEKKPIDEKKTEYEGQLTQLEATFTLDKVNLLFAFAREERE